MSIVNINSDNDRNLKSIEDYYKKNDSHFDIKPLKLTQSLQYEDRIFVTLLKLSPFNDVIIENYFICPLTNKVIFSNVSPYIPYNNEVLPLHSNDFKEIYSKSKDILTSEKTFYYSAITFSNKTHIIASVMKCNHEYIVCYFDEYNIETGQLTCYFNIPVFYKKIIP